jgi:alanine racemase
MDQCTADLSALPEAREGDEVLLLGSGPEGELPILEMAAWAKTNRNEILCAIGRRVPRLYHRTGTKLAYRDYVLNREELYG